MPLSLLHQAGTIWGETYDRAGTTGAEGSARTDEETSTDRTTYSEYTMNQRPNSPALFVHVLHTEVEV